MAAIDALHALSLLLLLLLLLLSDMMRVRLSEAGPRCCHPHSVLISTEPTHVAMEQPEDQKVTRGREKDEPRLPFTHGLHSSPDPHKRWTGRSRCRGVALVVYCSVFATISGMGKSGTGSPVDAEGLVVYLESWSFLQVWYRGRRESANWAAGRCDAPGLTVTILPRGGKLIVVREWGR
jgi:hypothetical protein